MPRKRLRIRRGSGLLANDNPAIHVSRSAELRKAGTVHRKSRRIVGVFILAICTITTVDRHWWPIIRAPRAQNGLRMRRRFSFEV